MCIQGIMPKALDKKEKEKTIKVDFSGKEKRMSAFAISIEELIKDISK